MTAVKATLRTVAPHPTYAPTDPRHVAVCDCGWESCPSLFKVFALEEFDRHATEVHDVPARLVPRDSLAACWAEAVTS